MCHSHCHSHSVIAIAIAAGWGVSAHQKEPQYSGKGPAHLVMRAVMCHKTGAYVRGGGGGPSVRLFREGAYIYREGEGWAGKTGHAPKRHAEAPGGGSPRKALTPLLPEEPPRGLSNASHRASEPVWKVRPRPGNPLPPPQSGFFSEDAIVFLAGAGHYRTINPHIFDFLPDF